MLVLEPNARNHFKIMTFGIEQPESEKEQIELAEKLYTELEQSRDKKKLYHTSSKKRGYMITVWELADRGYLIQCLKNEFDTYNNTVYISDNIGDLISIAKFLRDNIKTIMSDYKKQILDAKAAITDNTEVVDDTRA